MKSYTGALGLAMVATALAADSVGAQSFEHSAWDEVLQRYAHDSRVDYGALKADRDLLDRYLAQVAAVRVDEFASWPETEQIAYLINAYNAYAIETVIDNYPIDGGGLWNRYVRRFPKSSIRNISGAFDGIEHRAAGEDLTLDGIEHGKLRANYDEPRIHFALVCAAVSCPPLRGGAYVGARLSEQLDDQGKRFVNDPRSNRFGLESRRVYLSKIFDWYGDDFRQFAGDVGYKGDEKANGVLTFVSRYLLERTVAFLESGDYTVEFEHYDWTLNDQAIAAASQ